MERFNVSNIQMIVSLNPGIHIHCDVIRPEAVPVIAVAVASRSAPVAGYVAAANVQHLIFP